jgi:hypothetical protein
MKKLYLVLAAIGALMLASGPSTLTFAETKTKRLSQGFMEELGKIGKPAAPAKEKAKPKKKKKAAKKMDVKAKDTKAKDTKAKDTKKK